MISLTTDYGTFEGETEKDVLAVARKAKRAAKRAEAKLQEDRCRAVSVAQRNGYRAYVNMHDNHKCNWELIPRGSEFFPYGKLEFGKVSHQINCLGGAGELSLYRDCSLESVVWDNSGFTVLAFVRGPEGQLEAYAVGTHNGQLAAQQTPGITPDMFSAEAES